MSRVYNPDSAGKERNQLTRSIVLALRELMKQQGTDDLTRDLAAYVALALDEVNGTIEASVSAWEKRGYWVKADKFRLEWEWTSGYYRTLSEALKKEDWATVAMTSAKVAQKFNKITVPERNRLGTPWMGSWKKLMQA
ncbi:MAG: hypothetical protein VB013_02820 [Anaerolineaceae bacterium]|nr:hypothetical protein [Anaerolineaceae bacterium]